MLFSAPSIGWNINSAGSKIKSSVQQVRINNISAIDPRTAEFFLQEESEIVSSSRVWEQLSEAERPPLHAHLRRYLHTDAHRNNHGGRKSLNLSHFKFSGTSMNMIENMHRPQSTHLGMFKFQYVMSSVIQGLLGRHLERKGSWPL